MTLLEPEDDPRGRTKFGTDPDFIREIVWFNVVGLALLHLGAIYGVYLAATVAKPITVVWSIGILFTISQGVLMGAHRMWSHRAFKATSLIKILLLVLFSAAGENCLWVWVRDHRQHHQYSDTDADPHNATRGLFFSHMGWLMSRKHPLVIEMGKKVHMNDLEADKFIMLQKRYYKTFYTTFGILLPVAVPIVFWKEQAIVSFFVCFLSRQVILWHLTWSVNSVAHAYGTKPYNKHTLAVDSVPVAFMTVGEGWHNYHHTYPTDYKAAEYGMPYQGTTKIIELLASYGFVYDLKQVDRDLVKKTVLECKSVY